MKKLILSLSLLTALILSITGCKTVITNNTDGTSITNKVVDIKTITNTLDIVVPLGIQVAVGQDVNAIPYFQAATVVIDTLVNNGNYNPEILEQLLNNISVKELRTPEAKAAIQAGLSIYKSFAADAVTANLDKGQYGKVLVAFSNSIKTGLSRSPIVLKK